MSLAGKNVLVTGANAGIGREIARGLAKQGARVFLACRNAEKTKAVIDALAAETGNSQLEHLELDLSDLAKVQASAQAFLAKGLPLHVLVANAGLALLPGVTAQGFENTFGVNYLGHFLFVRLLQPALEAAKGARVVMVGSRAHERISAFDWNGLQAPTTTGSAWPSYARSKLANTLFAVELARRWKPELARVYVVHPGVIASEIWRNLPWPLNHVVGLFMRTPEEGARSALHCALSDEVASHHGRYYGERGEERRMNPIAEDPALGRELWEKSDAWVRPWLPGDASRN